jgi:hypothetical protein
MKYSIENLLPCEVVDPEWVHVKQKLWYRLRLDPGFLKRWHSPQLSNLYHLIVSCLTRGLDEKETKTVLKIWHQKHGHEFHEEEFIKWFIYAGDYAGQFIEQYEANRYWEKIRHIQSEPKAKEHNKLRIAYFLMNTEQATIEEIATATGIALKTVRKYVAILKADGKVIMPQYGVYQAVLSRAE